MESPRSNDQPIVFFDGVCNFCNYWVRFVLKRNRRKNLRFAPLQGETACRMLGEQPKDPDSVIFFENGKLYRYSTAALRIARHLDAPWNWIYPLIFIPRFLRDPLYRWVARNRYRWFGKKEECMVPGPEVRERFLE